MANNQNIQWSAKGSVIVESFGIDELDTQCKGMGENRYCPSHFEEEEVITFPDKENAEYFKRPFTKRDGTTDYTMMIKVHSSIRGEYFEDITSFLRIPIPQECGEFYKESSITYYLLKVLGSDVARARHLMGKQLIMHKAMPLHRPGWVETADGNYVSSTEPEHIKPLTCWAWLVL